jgi:DNA-binding transcriptional LysR family regulator
MKNINLEWLRTFQLFCTTENISEAADKLGISQPAVTLHLKNLELQFSEPLFQMVGRNKRLTAFGKELFKIVDSDLKLLEQKITQLELLQSDVTKAQIRLGGRRELLEKILTSFPSPTQLKAFESDTATALKKLKSLELDVVLAAEKPNSSDLIAKLISQDKAILVMHKSLLKKIKGQDIFSRPDIFSQSPVYFYKEQPPFLMEMYQFLGINFDNIQPQVIIDNWNVIASLVEKGHGYSIIPSSFKTGGHIERIELPKKINNPIEIHAIYHTSSRRSKAISHFLANFNSQ